MATTWLEKNTHNRPLTQRDVEKYAADMKAKRWDLNGETIIFDWNGVLQDGQHRLWACIEANTPFETIVTTGVNPAGFTTIDTGRKRNASDVLGISGISSNRHTLAAAAAVAIRYNRGILRSNDHVPNKDVVEFVNKNSDLSEWVAKAKKVRGFSAPYSAMLAGIMFLAARKKPVEAEEFLHKFQSGEDLRIGSPILALRNRLLTSKSSRLERLTLIVQAWNAFASKRSLTKMQLSKSDTFPAIIGAK
jgi:hypothetical protein